MIIDDHQWLSSMIMIILKLSIMITNIINTIRLKNNKINKCLKFILIFSFSQDRNIELFTFQKCFFNNLFIMFQNEILILWFFTPLVYTKHFENRGPIQNKSAMNHEWIMNESGVHQEKIMNRSWMDQDWIRNGSRMDQERIRKGSRLDHE